jgi:NADP-dependent 3-hydroxy acid dehydrogenase YdfG
VLRIKTKGDDTKMVSYYKTITSARRGKKVGFSVNIYGHTRAVPVKTFKKQVRQAVKSTGVRLSTFKRISAKEAARLSMKSGSPIRRFSKNKAGKRLALRTFRYKR